MHSIVLLDTDKYGPASTQLQSYGTKISDSWFRDYNEDIFSEFRINANKKYRLVGCRELDGLGKCGLCAHEIIYGCELRSRGEPLVTHHPDLDTSITWPDHMVVGTTCVKSLDVDSYVMRFVRSCFEVGYNPSYNTTENGRVLCDCVLRHTDMWNSSFKKLVLPHSVFNMIPKHLMEKAGLRVHVMVSPFDPKRKLEKTLYRSHNSRKGMWRTDYTVPAEESMYGECYSYRLATVLTRDDARRVCEIYYNERGRK